MNGPTVFPPDPGTEFLVSCLCAQWCGTCREYRPAYEALARTRPHIGFLWLDIEDDAELVGDVDVENFPTLVIQRGSTVLHYGPSLPDVGILARLLDNFSGESEASLRDYAVATPERRGWQVEADIRGRLARV